MQNNTNTTIVSVVLIHLISSFIDKEYTFRYVLVLRLHINK